MIGTTAASPPAARPLPVICDRARQVACGQCPAWPGTPCAHGPRTSAYHVSRFARARALRLITEADMGAVVERAEVFTAETLVFDSPDCSYLHSVQGPGCGWCAPAAADPAPARGIGPRCNCGNPACGLCAPARDGDPYPDAFGTCGCGLCLCWRGADGRDNLCGLCRAGRHGGAR